MDIKELPAADSWDVDGVTFVFGFGKGSTVDRFLIRKRGALFERYAALAERFAGGNIVELGIAAGGSTALLSLLATPRSLVACELDPEPVPALTELLERRGLAGVVQPFFGVDQADRARLAQLVDDHVAGPVDLVIDDASHLYRPTLASFEVLFPRLRPGGWYIIEDWAADYAFAKRIGETLSRPSPEADDLERRIRAVTSERSEPDVPLPRLAMELLQVCGQSPDVVPQVIVNPHWIVVERGPAGLSHDSFRVADVNVDHWGWLSG